ncbi:MAG: CBS domain-containing protein [Anaerolineae bacterium]
MTKDPLCCLASETVNRAAQYMKESDAGSVPIVDSPQTKRLLGIVTDRDLALKVVAESRDPRSVRIEEVMTRNPVTCQENDDLQAAIEAMARNQVRRIPVVDNSGHLVGIISQADIATRGDSARQTAEVVEEISKPEKMSTGMH